MTKRNICIILGKRIKEERLKRGMTQEELSEKINLNPKSVSFLERGCGVPSFDTFINIAKVFDVSLDSLLMYDKKDNTKKDNFISQIYYQLSDLTNEQQEFFLKTIKEFKKLAK